MIAFALVASSALAGSEPELDDAALGSAMDAAAARVEASGDVTDAAIAGHWVVRQALFRRHEEVGQPSVSDYTGLIGMGGFGFGPGGEYRAGAFQLPGTYALSGNHLHIVNPQGKPEDYDVAVHGDVMEWFVAEPAAAGDSGVDVYVVMQRDRAPGDCAELDGLPSQALPLLEGKYTVAMPAGTELEPWPDLPPMLGTQLAANAGETRLRVAMNELLARYGPGDEAAIRDLLGRLVPDGEHATGTYGAARAWTVVGTPAAGDGAAPTLAAVLVHPDGTVQRLAIRVESPSPGPRCAALAARALESVAPGPRSSPAGPSDIHLRYYQLRVDVPPGWLAWTRRVDDAAFFEFTEAPAVAEARRAARLSVRVPGAAWRATAGEARPLLGEPATWEAVIEGGVTRLRACTERACVEASAGDPATLDPLVTALGTALLE